MHRTDCQTALQRLEVVRPGSDDLRDPELAAATAHLRAHPECAEQFRARQDLDRAIGRAVRDVPVPAGLKERLLAQLRMAETGEMAPAVDEPTADGATAIAKPAARRRRAVWAAVSAAAVCLVAAASLWLLLPPWSPSVTMAQLRQSAKQAYEGYPTLPALPEEFESRLPDFGWRHGALAIAPMPRAVTPPDADAPVAAYQFRLPGGNITGVLLVVPAGMVSDPPEAKSLTRENVHYDAPYSIASWSEGDRVYVCLVHGPGDSIERLRQALTTHRAA